MWVKTHLAVVLQGEIESKSNNALGLGAARDFQTLDDARDALVLKAGVLSFSVFANYSEVDVGVTCGETRKGFTKDDRGVNVELLAHGDIP